MRSDQLDDRAAKIQIDKLDGDTQTRALNPISSFTLNPKTSV
jgi:hypothetical protein